MKTVRSASDHMCSTNGLRGMTPVPMLLSRHKERSDKNMTPHIDLSHPRCGALGRVLHIQKGWDNDLLTPAIIIPEMINYPRVLISFYRRQEFLEISCPTLNYCCCCCCSWCCCSLATGMLLSGSGRGSGSLIWCTTDTVLFPINSYSKWYFEMSVLGSPGTATPRF